MKSPDDVWMKPDTHLTDNNREHDQIVFVLLSERYHELLHSPATRDDDMFRKISVLYLEYKARIRGR